MIRLGAAAVGEEEAPGDEASSTSVGCPRGFIQVGSH
jgi:hypothetical protein